MLKHFDIFNQKTPKALFTHTMFSFFNCNCHTSGKQMLSLVYATYNCFKSSGAKGFKNWHSWNDQWLYIWTSRCAENLNRKTNLKVLLLPSIYFKEELEFLHPVGRYIDIVRTITFLKGFTLNSHENCGGHRVENNLCFSQHLFETAVMNWISKRKIFSVRVFWLNRLIYFPIEENWLINVYFFDFKANF